MLRWLRRKDADDEGVAMITVIGVAFVLTIFAVGMTTLSLNTLKSSGSHVVFSKTIDAAEAGIDQTLARLTKTNTYAYPSGLTISDPAFSSTTGWASVSAEKAWARAEINSLKNTAGAVNHTANGDFITVRAANLNTIYSMGFLPNVSNPTRTRLVKAEFIFSTYHPTNAILTNGNISCCPSYNVGLAPGVSSSTTIGIHSNGNLGGVPTSANGGTVTGTASGTCSSPCTAGTPRESVPAIDPRAIYNSQSPIYASNWYDLCPDGKVHAPNTASGAVPCTGSVVSATLPFRGWTRSGSTWDLDDGGTAYPGVYYVYQGSIHTGNSHTADITGATTLITESSNNRGCPKTDGDITFDNKSDWSGGPYIPGLMAVAGGNFQQNNQAAVSGAGGGFIAQGSVNQHTSAHDALVGLVLAEDFCGETNDLQGSILYYDGGDDLPIGQLIRTTLELELP
ncbi:MAG: hypothetical protein QOF18_406 [Frankiaceae bacterium]|nr:hypothetical protein [Frankiaceae bacterium]